LKQKANLLYLQKVKFIFSYIYEEFKKLIQTKRKKKWKIY